MRVAGMPVRPSGRPTTPTVTPTSASSQVSTGCSCSECALPSPTHTHSSSPSPASSCGSSTLAEHVSVSNQLGSSFSYSSDEDRLAMSRRPFRSHHCRSNAHPKRWSRPAAVNVHPSKRRRSTVSPPSRPPSSASSRSHRRSASLEARRPPPTIHRTYREDIPMAMRAKWRPPMHEDFLVTGSDGSGSEWGAPPPTLADDRSVVLKALPTSRTVKLPGGVNNRWVVNPPPRQGCNSSSSPRSVAIDWRGLHGAIHKWVDMREQPRSLSQPPPQQIHKDGNHHRHRHSSSKHMRRSRRRRSSSPLVCTPSVISSSVVSRSTGSGSTSVMGSSVATMSMTGGQSMVQEPTLGELTDSTFPSLRYVDVGCHYATPSPASNRRSRQRSRGQHPEHSHVHHGHGHHHRRPKGRGITHEQKTVQLNAAEDARHPFPPPPPCPRSRRLDELTPPHNGQKKTLPPSLALPPLAESLSRKTSGSEQRSESSLSTRCDERQDSNNNNRGSSSSVVVDIASPKHAGVGSGSDSNTAVSLGPLMSLLFAPQHWCPEGGCMSVQRGEMKISRVIRVMMQVVVWLMVAGVLVLAGMGLASLLSDV
ncbi:unnamed protein product [Vitrella brassicaformis CCMP3155]|uniref:Uncharacterized protein n=1 Tax=Vitrella brassicaformis (strain CCMP3155) TaxID=1169540 RepID=A0A0G4FYL4_VITBC|nr:unnamed protein product [Vitrella brassicaformis CCMP3155]|eukprot:CEM20298.1 unnamed protein product [Vitrella brassicaformis CCMP3155]